MIIQCESCVSKYFLPDAKIPPKPLKVSCPRCQAVFRLALPAQKVFASPADSVVPSGVASVQTAPNTAADAPKPVVPETSIPAKTARRRAGSSQDARARRLARVLVSDILCYNQDKRDQALLDGNLMTVLGDEIKKSWELYKEKVGPELANSTNYFKEALNEILADGQKVF
ncbi:MAG: zinc-ribbon domain-containing protein [Candidatus Latescibacterota bacterium]|nr:MAG: zinc-ribbon domain-containing protein [Candidatus Latescibacterota bacterium]